MIIRSARLRTRIGKLTLMYPTLDLGEREKCLSAPTVSADRCFLVARSPHNSVTKSECWARSSSSKLSGDTLSPVIAYRNGIAAIAALHNTPFNRLQMHFLGFFAAWINSGAARRGAAMVLSARSTIDVLGRFH